MKDFYERFEILGPHYQDGDEIVIGTRSKIDNGFRDLSEMIGDNIEYEGALLKLISFKPWISCRMFCDCCIPQGTKVVFRFRLLEKLF